MKKHFLTITIAALCLSVKAQTKPIDTATCNVIVDIQKKAIELISASNAPTDKSDAVRQQLQTVAQYFLQKKAEIIADDKKKTATAVPAKKQ
jgi:hypothetical protein